jgi:hypothetical protein
MESSPALAPEAVAPAGAILAEAKVNAASTTSMGEDDTPASDVRYRWLPSLLEQVRNGFSCPTLPKPNKPNNDLFSASGGAILSCRAILVT